VPARRTAGAQVELSILVAGGSDVRRAICLLILLALLCIALEGCKKKEEEGRGPGRRRETPTRPAAPSPRRGEELPGE